VRRLPSGEDVLTLDAPPGTLRMDSNQSHVALLVSELTESERVELSDADLAAIPGLLGMSVSKQLERLEVRELASFELSLAVYVPRGFGGPVLSPDGRFVAGPVAGEVWQVRTATRRLAFPHSSPAVCAFSGDASLFASSAGDGRVRVRETTGWAPLADIDARGVLGFRHEVATLAVTEERSSVHLGATDGGVYEWKLKAYPQGGGRAGRV
jgi:hypothetical protein